MKAAEKVMGRAVENIVRCVNNERGNMFIFSLIILVVLTVMGLGLMTITTNTLKSTTNERDDQAVYYIAEAGLVQQRAEIYSKIKTIYTQLKAVYDGIEDPKIKSQFNFDERFMNEVINIPVHSESPIRTAYEEHFDQAAYSEVRVERVVNGPNIEFIITSAGSIGDDRKRTVTQSLAVSLDDVKHTEEITIGDGEPATKLNACYTVFTYGKMTASGGGNFNGDIYSTEAINMSASPVINGKMYSTENITISGTPTQLKGVFSEKDIKITGAPTVDGYVIAGGNVNISNGRVVKEILSNKNIDIPNWPTLDGEMIARGNISIQGGHFGDEGLRAIAKGSINIENWTEPKKTIYAGTLTTKVNYAKPGPISSVEADALIAQYEQNILKAAGLDAANPYSLQNECSNSVPNLDTVENVFEEMTFKPSEFNKIVLPTLYTGEYTIDSMDDVQINTIDLYSDTNYRISQLAISMNKPNGVLDVSKAYLRSGSTLRLNLSSNNTVYIKELTATEYGSNLIIDLNGGDHTLYVDSLTSDGTIQLLNGGTLKIYVKDTMNLTNSRINRAGEAKNLSIYYAGSGAFTLQGGSHINGDLHVKNANLTLTASGHVYGDVFVYGRNKVTVSGGSSAAQQLFLAPRSEFVLGGGATINGNVVADKFTSSGGFTINAPQPQEGGGGEGMIVLPIDEYGDADDLFERSPQLET